MATEQVGCPDGGTCHHACDAGAPWGNGACFRVLTCEPLSGVFPENRWPTEVTASHKAWAKAEGDYYYLCCECGGIAPHAAFVAMKEDEDDGGLVLVLDEDDPSIIVCPLCRHPHQDNDSGAGIFDGTRAEVEAERASYLSDLAWAEKWADTARDRGAAG